MNIATDRGGPFAREPATARNWMRAAAPEIAFRFSAAAPRAHAAAIYAPIHFRKHWAYICIALLALVGSASFGHGVYIYAKAQLAQVLLHAAWERARVSGAAEKPWPWADTHPLVRLIAPAHDADVLVLAGASGRTLAFGPGHLDGSAHPGDAGNAVITAHRDTHFRFLKHVDTGDELVIERAGGDRRRFRIRNAYVADHRELHLPRDTAVPILTLVTCYPFDALNPGGPLRYVVIAEAA
ncbi:MAG: class GN sortase [Betaproteobacteria bacterium]